jgi:manganese transport protein
VSVGYIDPGNWATDLEGGARFGFQLLWVLVGSGLIAILLQTSSARLGMATGLDLAEACRSYYPENVRLPLWLLAEIGIVACDLAEVIGSAVALQLLFGLPLVVGALLTAADALVILALQRHGPRSIELLVTALVGIIGVSLGIQVWLAAPAWPAVASGLVPRLPKDSLYLAMGILGATIMPHNLYLHSALVAREATASGRRTVGSRQIWLSTVFALAVALVLNAAILVVAAAVFFTRSLAVTDLRDAHHLLAPLVGSGSAAALFAVALLCSGQSSTVTGTLAGQIVMEGFVRLRLPPVQRRALTRGLAIIPAVVVLSVAGEAGAMPLLVASQVLLSLQLPFAMIPLVRFTSSRAVMGPFVNPLGIRILIGLCAALVSAANGVLVARLISAWASVPFAAPLATVLAGGALLLLGYVSACSLRTSSGSAHALLVPPS